MLQRLREQATRRQRVLPCCKVVYPTMDVTACSGWVVDSLYSLRLPRDRATGRLGCGSKQTFLCRTCWLSIGVDVRVGGEDGEEVSRKVGDGDSIANVEDVTHFHRPRPCWVGSSPSSPWSNSSSSHSPSSPNTSPLPPLSPHTALSTSSPSAFQEAVVPLFPGLTEGSSLALADNIYNDIFNGHVSFVYPPRRRQLWTPSGQALCDASLKGDVKGMYIGQYKMVSTSIPLLPVGCHSVRMMAQTLRLVNCLREVTSMRE